MSAKSTAVQQHQSEQGEQELHHVLSKLLKIELVSQSLQDCLGEALDIILSAPFSALLPSGGIFLTNSKNMALELTVTKNLATPLLTLCKKIDFGYCMCGRAASEKKIVHSDSIDHRHDVRFNGMKPHGHYNVPILSGEKVLGVLVLYLPHGHDVNQHEIYFLESVSLILTGIIERKRYQVHGDSRHQTLIENLPQRIFYKDTHFRYVSCNHLFAQDIGVSLSDIQGNIDENLFPPKRAAFYRAEDKKVIQTGEVIELDETRLVNGNKQHFHRIKAPVKDNEGVIIGVVGMYWDITQQKQAELAIMESEEKFSAMANSATDPIIMVDETDQVVFWNTASEETFGFTAEDIAGCKLHEWIVPEEYRQLFKKIFSPVIKTGKGKIIGKTLEVEALRKDGKRLPIELSVSSVQIKGRWHVIGILRDISSRKEAEREHQMLDIQLRQAQKLESIGQLAAGIAHEINTPTQFVGDNTSFLQEAISDYSQLLNCYERLATAVKNEEDTTSILTTIKNTIDEIDLEFLQEEIPKSIEQSLDGLSRISRIVRAMKEFSHPGTTDKTSTNLNKAIKSTIEVSRNEWKYHADLNTEFDESLPQVTCLPDEINQVFLNLIVNAAHAIAEKDADRKGIITITTKSLDDSVQLTVNDSGAGIPEAIRERIFDPFFTTKKVGKGTGQGLSIAYSVIVDKHNGTIKVDSVEGKGSTFTITLPVK